MKLAMKNIPKNTVIIEKITTRNGKVVSRSIAYVSPMTASLYRLLWRMRGVFNYLYSESGWRKLINRLASIQAA